MGMGGKSRGPKDRGFESNDFRDDDDEKLYFIFIIPSAIS